jgi:hypothetical protein
MRLLVEDKWDTWICEGDNAALDLVRQRLEAGFWYHNWDEGDPQAQWEDRARAIVEAEDNDEAWDFLQERSDFEYEYVREI